jgi:FAD dependent oxidoreductase TIGR03364
MPQKNAIVIGAGIVGLATARALALKGYSIKIYERNFKASGASVRNFGMIWPIGQSAGLQYDRAIRSRNCWREIGDRSNLWYDPVGSMHLAYHEDEWQVLQELFEIFTKEDRDVFLLDKDQVSKKSRLANVKNCLGGLFSNEEIIVDPRDAISKLPVYFQESLNVQFVWGKTVTAVRSGQITIGSEIVQTDLIFICSGSDFETLYPEHYSRFPLTKCKLQMMRLVQEGSPRIGPALCGGLSLIHYASFKTATSLNKLKKRYENEMPDFLKLGIHVMVSQNQSGQLTVGDSHEYGLAPDPFDRKYINDLILKYLNEFAVLKKPELVESWNGVYAKLTNGQTDLFDSPESGVFIINALGGAGMTLSFGLAEELIDRI